MSIETHLTIFGGTGDLTFRKLIPALYTMDTWGNLPRDSKILIIGRRDYTSEEYRKLAHDWVEKNSRLPFRQDKYEQFAQRIEYYKMNFTDLSEYKGLDEYYHGQDIENHIFYYAVAPQFFSVITEGLKSVRDSGRGKVILEKPFGEDLPSAKKLNEEMEAHFGAEGIYRIDHYLGKEMVRNIQAIRFTNPIFTDVWNAHYIESVQISALEDMGVESRGGYYDKSGALKDMVQNHLLQILSIVAMEQPLENTPEALHEAQQKVFQALRQPSAKYIEETLVLGQYDGYRQEPLVDENSQTETFAALRLFIDNQRWNGTPFYIRTGKKTGKREIELSIIFRKATPYVEPNILIIKIQPTEGVYLQFNIKRPGDTDDIIPTKMDFCQNCNLVHHLNTPEAYERLISACIAGESSWFSQWNQIELCWNYVSLLKELYEEQNLPVYGYKQDTPGPTQAERLLDGSKWML